MAPTTGKYAIQRHPGTSKKLCGATKWAKNPAAGTAHMHERLRNGEPLPGFSGDVDRPDPRTAAIMSALTQALPDEQD